jgi:hypothetical protein
LGLLWGACGVASLARASSPGGATRLACAQNQVQRGPRLLPRRLLVSSAAQRASKVLVSWADLICRLLSVNALL